MADTRPDATDAFIARWQGVTASELSTSQSLLSDLCRLLGVDTPHPDAERAYICSSARSRSPTATAAAVPAASTCTSKRGAFVLESKKLKATTHNT